VLRVGLVSRMEEVDKPQPPKETQTESPHKKGSNLFKKPKNNRVLCIQFCNIKNVENYFYKLRKFIRVFQLGKKNTYSSKA
jgi:hypothetical protein